jgi:hypothetical protein
MTEQHSQGRSAHEGKPKMTARKGQADRNRENRKSRTELNSLDNTARERSPGKEYRIGR